MPGIGRTVLRAGRLQIYITLHIISNGYSGGLNSTAVALLLLLILTYTMSFTSNHVREVQPQLSLLSRLSLGSQAYGIVALSRTVTWLRGWHQYFYPSGYEPNATKTYKTRSNLPVRYVILTSTSFRAEQNYNQHT
jgi:hypothetical protein